MRSWPNAVQNRETERYSPVPLHNPLKKNKKVEFRHGVLLRLNPSYRKWLKTEIDTDRIGPIGLYNVDYYIGFLSNNRFVFLGEIPNMEGHCIVAGQNGRIYFGFHTEDFVELHEDEV